MDTESFSKSKAMELPRNVVVGHDALHTVGEVCQSLKLGKRALIVADETTMKIAGMTVEKELAARKIRTSEFLIPDATMKEVREGEEKIRKGNIEFALGGEGLGPRAEPPERILFVVRRRAERTRRAPRDRERLDDQASTRRERVVRVQGPRLERGRDVDRRLLAARVGERTQVLPRPRPDREEARPARGAVRRRDDHDDVPPRWQLAGSPGRAPGHRRADDGAGARRHGR